MRAIKLTAQINAKHELNLHLPDDVPPGMAEVIVLVDEQQQVVYKPRSLSEFMDRLRDTDIPRRSKEEIDRSLEEERALWEHHDAHDLPR